jgi:hypothetical protein
MRIALAICLDLGRRFKLQFFEIKIFYILFSNAGFKYKRNVNFFSLQDLVKFCYLAWFKPSAQNSDFTAIIFLALISQRSLCPEIQTGELFYLRNILLWASQWHIYYYSISPVKPGIDIQLWLSPQGLVCRNRLHCLQLQLGIGKKSL